jgi:hypothetical protein
LSLADWIARNDSNDVTDHQINLDMGGSKRHVGRQRFGNTSSASAALRQR